eukprot:gene32286-39865_t
MAIIQAIGPRLTDPRAKTEYFMSLFRFAEEKQMVEEVLKVRTNTMSAAAYNKGDSLKVMTAGRGAGGRGGAGRGPGVAGRGGRGAGAVAAGRGPVIVVMDPSPVVTPTTVQKVFESVPADEVTSPVTKSVLQVDTVSFDWTLPVGDVQQPAPMSPPPYSKALLCATPETPAQKVLSSGLDDVFDMLDRLPINPDAPLVMSAAKEVRRASADPLMTSIREESEDDSSLRSTPVGEMIRIHQSGTPLGRMLHSPAASSECLVPETSTPRSDSGSTTVGDFSPYSPDASVTSLAEKRAQVTPSPATREETVFETDSLKMIVETCKSSNKSSIRLVTRTDSLSSQHYHEATPGSRSRMNSMDAQATSSALSGIATAVTPGLSSMFSPSSTVAAPAETPRTYDRAAMLSRMQSAGTASSTDSDYSSPIISPAPMSSQHHMQPLSVDVSRVLFDGAVTEGVRSPVAAHPKALNLGSFNGTPRRYDNQTQLQTSESADSSGSEGACASSQLDTRTHRTESLEDYFDKPRVYAISPDVVAQKAAAVSSLTAQTTPVITAGSPNRLASSPAKKSYVPPSTPPSYIVPVSANSSDRSWRDRIPASIDEEEGKLSTTSKTPTGLSSPRRLSTSTIATNAVPFVTPSKSSLVLGEEVAAVSVDFAALRNAFAKNEGGASGSKQYSRRMSTGASASFYISNTSTINSGTTNSLSLSTPSGDQSAPATPGSSTPMLHKALSTNNMTRGAMPLRRHTDFAPQTSTAVLMMQQNDTHKVSVANVASLGSDVASKCAAALKMTKGAFAVLTLEEGWESDQPDGAVAMYYSYQELVRRNFAKEYVDLTRSELEKYLCDEEFATVFQKTKDQFFAQPRWKQMDQKKKAMLF